MNDHEADPATAKVSVVGEPATSEPTLDGRRLGISELNLPSASAHGRWRRALNNLSMFLAGMYTGESCAGTPHSARKRSRANPQEPPI
jgi:hypothetical protein